MKKVYLSLLVLLLTVNLGIAQKNPAVILNYARTCDVLTIGGAMGGVSMMKFKSKSASNFWSIESKGEGKLLKNEHNGRYLSVKEGKVVFSDNPEEAEAVWIFERTSDNSGAFLMKNAASGKYLGQLKLEEAAGADQLHRWEMVDNRDGVIEQFKTYYQMYSGGEFFRIKNQTGGFISTDGKSLSVVQGVKYPIENTKWTKIEEEGSKVYIKNTEYGVFLTIDGDGNIMVKDEKTNGGLWKINTENGFVILKHYKTDKFLIKSPDGSLTFGYISSENKYPSYWMFFN